MTGQGKPPSALDRVEPVLLGITVLLLLLLSILIAGYLGFCLVGSSLCVGWIAAYQWIEHEEELEQNAHSELSGETS